MSSHVRRDAIPFNQPVSALVTADIHGWSRNPIYIGMFLVYAGIGIAARSPLTLILVLPLAIILRYAVVAREEAYLGARLIEACTPHSEITGGEPALQDLARRCADHATKRAREVCRIGESSATTHEWPHPPQ